MGGFIQFIGDWGHVLCAALFAGLTIWTSRRFATLLVGKLLVAALSLTAIWSLSIAFGGVDRLESGVMESLRNCAWLICLSTLPVWLGQGKERQGRAAAPLYAALLLLLIGQCALDIFAGTIVLRDNSVLGRVADAAVILRMLWAIGVLILLQRTFIGLSPRGRRIAAPIAAAMATMWSYDLLLYAAAFLKSTSAVIMIFALRGGVMALLAPMVVIGMRGGVGQTLSPSRALAWRGVGAAMGLAAMLLVLLALFFIDSLGSPVLRAIATGGVFVLAVGGLLVLPSTRLHAQLKLLVAKHLFRHRYDYREQWMSFVDTIGSAGGTAGVSVGGTAGNSADGKTAVTHATIYERVVKAMADITQSPSAALLMPDASGGFRWHSAWNWRDETPADCTLPPEMTQQMRARNWIVDVAQERAGDTAALPAWLEGIDAAWALVPILHYDTLVGVMLLTRPPVMRPLDWEDFDMLRAAGRQVASYIAEAQGQQALADARRFDEFNRRFAFIMHDIKNLVSQIALVARNAQRHADNPEFRQDMVLTLKECADKMNMLLARLAQHNSAAEPEQGVFALGDIARAVVSAKGAGHPLLVEGDLAVATSADRAKVEQIVGHLVQNAIEASAPDAPVRLRIDAGEGRARIAVIDHGCGMSAEFLRDDLFRPFASTKSNGFGIGAYEARELARAMGGALSVESMPGKGSIFTLALPLAAHNAPEFPGNGHNEERVA